MSNENECTVNFVRDGIKNAEKQTELAVFQNGSEAKTKTKRNKVICKR